MRGLLVSSRKRALKTKGYFTTSYSTVLQDIKTISITPLTEKKIKKKDNYNSVKES